jgi:hypothetical protein
MYVFGIIYFYIGACTCKFIVVVGVPTDFTTILEVHLFWLLYVYIIETP